MAIGKSVQKFMRKYFGFVPKYMGYIPEYYVLGAEKKIPLDEIEGFSPIAIKVLAEQRTYLHLDRLYILWQALSHVPSSSIVIEVGAYRGGSAKFIHNALRYMGKQSKFYVCDTFSGHPVVDESVDGDHKTTEGFKNTSAADVQKYMSDCWNFEIVAGDIMKISEPFYNSLTAHGKGIGMLHLDCDVYPPTKFCLEHFGRDMVYGGVIVVDDYGFKSCKGVKKAVDEYLAYRRDFRAFHLTTGQMVLVCIQ